MTPAEPPRDHTMSHAFEDSHMQPHSTDTHDPADAQLDQQLRRTMLAGAGDAEELDFSRRVAAHALDDAIADEARRRSPRIRPRRMPALAAIGGLAAAVLVAGALAPGGSGDGDGPRTATTPFAAETASAAEVLEQAAERMLATDGASIGNGPAWHAVATGSGVWESWFDSTRNEARWAWFSSGTSLPDSYYVLDVHADGSSTIRQYERVDGAWKPVQGGSQMNGTDASDIAIMSSIESEALAWLRAADAASGPEDLREANLRFVERTHMFFTPPSAGGRLGEPAAARALQLLYLLRIARLEPAAVAQLYRDVIDLEDLQRLEDGRVEGRDVIRLRLFDPPTGPGGDTLASVLLLDERTGEPIGMESTSGGVRELFETPTRTSAVGAKPVSCGTAELPPCELLRGEGPIAGAADRIATRVGAPVDPTPGLDSGAVGNEPAS